MIFVIRHQNLKRDASKVHSQIQSLCIRKMEHAAIKKLETANYNTSLFTSYKQVYLRCAEPVGDGFCQQQLLAYDGAQTHFRGKFHSIQST